MQVAPQLEFDGNCREAFEYYAALFSAEITVMNTLGDTKDVPLPPGSSDGGPDMVRFAELRVGQARILGNDLPKGQYRALSGFSIALHFDTADEARRVFQGLSEGGHVTTAPAKVAWAALFGMVTDRFGVPWLVLGMK